MSAVLVAILFGSFSLPTVVAAQEKLVAPEQNPPGDIPDNQVFVDYHSSEGFTLKIPEGWSRIAVPGGVRFSDKYDVVEITSDTATAAPKAADAKAGLVATLKKAGRAVQAGPATSVKLKAGSAVRIDYMANSEINPVTNKQIRLEHQRFIFFKNGKTISVDVAAPAGADNVDQWQFISNSFGWDR